MVINNKSNKKTSHSVEPHKNLLDQPPDMQLLYKVMRVEDLISSISGAYLYFNRVDSYKDFPGADEHDGQQLPQDKPGNEATKFLKHPEFSAANCYDLSRSRTYTFCCSLKNSDYIWCKYGNGNKKGKVCVIFEFGKLRSMLNKTFENENTVLEYNGLRCQQLFFINYGLVKYTKWHKYQANTEHLPNPIIYSYLKDEQYHKDQELRITLSTLAVGRFILNGKIIDFPKYLQITFNFKAAIANGTIRQILYAHDCDSDFLLTELRKLGIKQNQNTTN